MRRQRSISAAAALLAIGFCALFASAAFAHEAPPESYHELAGAWEFDPGVVIPLLITAWLYLQGLWRIWGRSGAGRGIRFWQAGCFALGWIWLVIALVSPLHPWGEALFSVHMAQHEILMVVAAPLLILGRPLPVMLMALPRSWASALGHASNLPAWQSTWHAISHPVVAWFIHFIALWIWHAPRLMDAAIDNDFIHALQHLSFLLSALLFWWAIVHGPRRALGYGMAVLYLFTTALHSGFLGVLLAFTGSSWYPAYAYTTQAWGLTPLQDQQLGGLIMWIPAGVVYIVAALALLAGWLKESETRAVRNRARWIITPGGQS